MIFVFALFFILCGLDWAPWADPSRDGALRFVALTGVVVGPQLLKHIISKSGAIFLSYIGMMWVLHDYQPNASMHVLYIMLALIVSIWLSNFKKLPDWIVRIGVLQAIFGVAQFTGWNPWHYNNPWEIGKPTGTFGQETILGAFLTVALVPALFTKKYLSAIIIAICIILTHSTMSAVAAFAGVMFWIGVRSIFVLIPGLLIALTAFHFSHESRWFSFNGRLPFWEIGVRGWLEHPFFGHGPGAWLPNAPVIDGLLLSHIHNEWIELLYEYGLVGFCLSIACLFPIVFRRAWAWYHVVCLVLCINAIGNFPFHIANLGVLFLTSWIISIRADKIEVNKNKGDICNL